MKVNRRSFLMQAGAASFNTGILATPALAADGVSAMDRERMRSVAAFTAETLSTDHPMPFGANTVSTATGERLMRSGESRGSRPRSQRACRNPDNSTRLRQAGLGIPQGLHPVYDVRAVCDVHGLRSLVRPGPAGLRSYHCRCEPVRLADSDPGEGSGAPDRPELHRGRASRARGLREVVH
jgi:hypothetical protein